MREPWIRCHAQLVARPVVTRMATALRIDPFKAAGHLVTFWGAVSANATNGHIATVPDALLERWAGWTTKKGRFAAWVRAEHMDENGRVNEWDQYQGKLEAKREKERLRKGMSRGCPRDVTRTVPHRPQDVREKLQPARANGTVSTPTSTGQALPAPRGKGRGVPPEGGTAYEQAELAELNRLRAIRGEPPLTRGDLYSA